MTPKTLLPLPTQEHEKGGWMIDVGFIKAIQTSTENLLTGVDATPSLEQVEAVLLASNTQFLRCWITAGGQIPKGGIKYKHKANAHPVGEFSDKEN